MVFANRRQAAELLADAMAAYKGRHPLILAIPRGAVAMGQQLARGLDGELDVVLVRKLRAPFNSARWVSSTPISPQVEERKSRPSSGRPALDVMALGSGRAQIDIDPCLLCTSFKNLGIAQEKQLGGKFSALLFNFISQGIRI